MAERLSDHEISEALQGTDWSREGESIVREVKLDDFRGAVALVNRVAEAAEDANHHPDITIHGYNRVRLTLSTHSAGGLTGADLSLARKIDELI